MFNKKVKTFFGITSIVLVLVMVTLVVLNLKPKDKYISKLPLQLDNTYEYTAKLSNNSVKIQIDYCSNWSVEEINPRDATDTIEASPDCGIDIYMSEDHNTNKISVVASIPRVSIADYDEFEWEDFVTNTGTKGRIYSIYDDDKIIQKVILNDVGKLNYYLLVITDRVFYEENSTIIMDMLKSFKVY